MYVFGDDNLNILKMINSAVDYMASYTPSCLNDIYCYMAYKTRADIFWTGFHGDIFHRILSEKYRSGIPRIEHILLNSKTETKTYYPTGVLRNIKRSIKGHDCHCDNAPALISYYKTGQISSESWRQKQKCHRIDGPAVTKYYPNGKIKKESWWYNGERHRDNNPATIAYRPDGSVQYTSWWYHGTHLAPQ